jgi:membrane protein
MSCRAVFFDLDGTLVDSNGFHAEAWVQAFADAGHAIAPEHIAGQIGKGADNLVPALLPEVDAETVQALGDAHGRIFKARYLPQVRPFPQARALVEHVHATGRLVALASSAGGEELEHYQALLGLDGLVDVVTTIDDVEHSKPAPDIFAVALRKAEGIAAGEVVVIGDSPFDMAAARRCAMTAVGLRSGGFADEVLLQAGADMVFDSVADVLARYDQTPLAY